MRPDLSWARWRKSARSGVKRDCVEAAANLPGVVAVRDSKDRTGPALVFTCGQWESFVASVKNGDFGRR